MNSHNITPDSLTQLLTNFQAALAPLLDKGKIEQWDGRTLLDREEKIRESALVLAGKCIALLLEKLSSWDKAQETALVQTKGWWRQTVTSYQLPVTRCSMGDEAD